MYDNGTFSTYQFYQLSKDQTTLSADRKIGSQHRGSTRSTPLGRPAHPHA